MHFSIRLFQPAVDIFQVVTEFMEIVEKVAEDKQEQHANANGQLTAPNDLPYTKERLAMMSIIVQRIMTQTGKFLALPNITKMVKTIEFVYNEKLLL
jgi:hypothetical protein